MISVKVIRNQKGDIVSMDAKGHANYGHSGSDIVCAGVSALLHAVYAALVQNLNCVVSGEAAHGLMSFTIRSDPTRLTHEVFGVGIVGLRLIAEAYPDRLTVIEEAPQ